LVQVWFAWHWLFGPHGASQWPTTQMSPPVQSLSTLHGLPGFWLFGFPPDVGLPPLPPPEPPVPGWAPPVPPRGRLGFDGLSRVHAPAAAINKLAATAPSRLLTIGRDIVLLRGLTPSVGKREYKRHAATELREIRRPARRS
jgi:hypothetical protein